MFFKSAIVIALLLILSSCSDYRSTRYDPYQNGLNYQYNPPKYNLPKQDIRANLYDYNQRYHDHNREYNYYPNNYYNPYYQR